MSTDSTTTPQCLQCRLHHGVHEPRDPMCVHHLSPLLRRVP